MNQRVMSLFLLVASACGGGDGSATFVDVEDPSAFCRATAEISCTTMYECLTPAEREAKKLPATVAECERMLESRCEDGVDACNTATTAYASSAARDCLDEMLAATCNDASEPWLDARSCQGVCATTAGVFALRWAFSPSYYSCADIGVTTVAVVSREKSGQTYVDRFDCYVGSGITDVLPLGTYSVFVELYNASQQNVWTSTAAVVTLDDDRLDLGTLTIPVSN